MSEHLNFKKRQSYVPRRVIRQTRRSADRGNVPTSSSPSPSPSRIRHPPHLRGRDIGLFYAKRDRGADIEKMGPLGSVLLSESQKSYITDILKSTEYLSSVNSDEAYGHIEDSAFKRDFLRVINETIESKLDRNIRPIEQDNNLDQIFFEENCAKMKNTKYREMLSKRLKLPSYKMKDEILELINNNQIVVISGETGCGKTTQVAQFILDDYIMGKRGSACRIICTQPRRISAISIAERVADERTEKIGNSVGYHIRLERRTPRDQGSICYCTTGIVLKLMEDDAALSWVSHLILDEIHERDVLSDFILALFKKITRRRKDLKLILMSATLNAEKFSNFYNGAPHINIPGFTFPVKEYFLEDVLERTRFEYSFSRQKLNPVQHQEFSGYIEPHVRQLESTRAYSRNVCIQLRKPESEVLNLELVLALLIDICQTEQDEGAILVFLTGFQEISNLIQLITNSGAFPPHQYVIFPLHSLMPTIDQKEIFSTALGKRKIIVATNIAETSITIDDVVFVIDCGLIKITNYDPVNNTESLKPQWVSLANASQRKGRAGRVKPGTCFHLYSKAREMMLEQYQKPEILRQRLEDTILSAKVLQLGLIEPFFEQLIDSPDPDAVKTSLDLLLRLNALTDDEKLTPLGYHLAKLPMAPQLGKMVLLGAIFSCLDPILSIAATLDFKEPYQMPLGHEKDAALKRVDLTTGLQSDHLTYYETIRRYETSENDRRYFCWNYYLSEHTLKLLVEVKQQFAGYLCDMNFLSNANPKDVECNRNSDNISLIKAIVCAGLYPNVTIAAKFGSLPKIKLTGGKIRIHPKSVLSNFRRFDTNIMVYYRRLFSNADYVHDGTIVYPLPIIFFGDHFAHGEKKGRSIISISKVLKFKCTNSTAQCIEGLRDRFNGFLEHKIAHPGPVIWQNNDTTQLLFVIKSLITSEDTQEFDDDVWDDHD